MRKILLAGIFILGCFNTYSQAPTVRGNQYQLTGKLINKVTMPAHCGTIAWATVLEIAIEIFSDKSYSAKNMAVIVTCPTIYGDSFFVTGKSYRISFADRNQADFSWAIMDEHLLKKYNIGYRPFVLSINKQY